MASGCEAVAPTNHPSWERKVSERYGFASVWSERHAAYVAGLGTFGLCDGLITPAGKAMRCGSVVARIQIPPTERPYTDHHAYCLHFSHGTCGKCIERCPAGAITRAGHDKKKCLDYEDNFTTPYVQSRFRHRGLRLRTLPNRRSMRITNTGSPIAWEAVVATAHGIDRATSRRHSTFSLRE